MTRWGFLLGALVLVLVFAGTRTTGTAPVAAQSDPATPAAQAANGTAEAGPARFYEDFVGKLASNLGLDADQVDTAVRTTLKQMVDERQAAGDLSTEQANTIKDRIDSPDFPRNLAGMMGAWGGQGRGRPGEHPGGQDHGGMNNDHGGKPEPGRGNQGNNEKGSTKNDETSGNGSESEQPAAESTPTM